MRKFLVLFLLLATSLSVHASVPRFLLAADEFDELIRSKPIDVVARLWRYAELNVPQDSRITGVIRKAFKRLPGNRQVQLIDELYNPGLFDEEQAEFFLSQLNRFIRDNTDIRRFGAYTEIRAMDFSREGERQTLKELVRIIANEDADQELLVRSIELSRDIPLVLRNGSLFDDGELLIQERPGRRELLLRSFYWRDLAPEAPTHP